MNNRVRKIAAIMMFAVAMTVSAATPRYIFYFIGDGMGLGHVMTASNWKKTVMNDTTSLALTTLPVTGLCTTMSANTPVTDSAAAGTALATGTKTNNDMLGISPDSVALKSVAKQLQELGYGIGLVTSVCADDATPGAFYANVPSRGMYYEIGVQAAKSGFDFIAGSGLRGRRDKQGNTTNLDSIIARYNYSLVQGIDNLAGATTPKIILLDNDPLNTGSIGYAIEAKPGAMTLEAMTRACVDHLEKVAPEQFFMMVEGGAIDWASHSNDAATVVNDLLAFDNALDIALEFYKRHPEETLIVVTADHETGGLSLGNTSTGYAAHLDLLKGQRISKDSMSAKVKNMLRSRRIYGRDDIYTMLAEDLGLGTVIGMTAADSTLIDSAYNITFVDRNGHDIETLYAKHDPLTVAAFEILDNHSGAGWTSIHHTGNPVGVYAIGVGSMEFTGFIDNTDIPKKIMYVVDTYKDAPVMMRQKHSPH